MSMKEHKDGSLTIHSRIRLGTIFPISRAQSSRKKILYKKYVSGSLFSTVIAKKMCLNLSFGHHFDNNIGTARNFSCRLNVLESTHLELEFEHKFRISSMEIKSVFVL